LIQLYPFETTGSRLGCGCEADVVASTLSGVRPVTSPDFHSFSDVNDLRTTVLGSFTRNSPTPDAYANGRYYLATAGQKQTAERNAFEIRLMTQTKK
jgi:hypothetical protein